MAGIRPYQAIQGGHDVLRHAPLGPTQTYDHWDPVQISSNQLITSPKDGSIILDDEFVGFAADDATGIIAASRSAAMVVQQGHGGTGGSAAENAIRSYIVPTPDQLWATNNFWTTAAGTTQDVVGGGDLQGVFQISSAAAGEWGLVDASATIADHVAARIINIVDERGVPFTADTADTACTGSPTTGPTIVFSIANIHALDQISGG